MNIAMNAVAVWARFFFLEQLGFLFACFLLTPGGETGTCLNIYGRDFFLSFCLPRLGKYLELA